MKLGTTRVVLRSALSQTIANCASSSSVALLQELNALLIKESELGLAAGRIQLDEPRNPEHGDYATNIALVSAKKLGVNPRAVADALATEINSRASADSTFPFTSAEVAGAGFLNLRLNRTFVAALLAEAIAKGDAIAASAPVQPLRMNVEFVSVNPNGPITIGSGRGAAFGDTLVRILRAVGHQVDAEFYINDALNSEQMRLFAESVRYYLAELEGNPIEFPENGYRGDYVKDVATDLQRTSPTVTSRSPLPELQRHAQDLMIARQRTDLAAFGVVFDRWFSEQSLHDAGTVTAAIEKLLAKGLADSEPIMHEVVRDGKTETIQKTPQEPGPIWLRSQQFGDDKDRPLVRTDGRPAYIAGDLAYMDDKLSIRGYDKALLILGPDHHGYIGRMYAVRDALGFDQSRFEIIIYQLVRFLKEGQPAPMRKRDGNIYELRDLVSEIGVDAARFFYLMRSHESLMDFDIDLATSQSDDNPVYYVQYAHARICSILEKASAAGFSFKGWNEEWGALLNHDRELALMKKLYDLPEEVKRCADDFAVHRIATYSLELARSFHHFYDACKVIQPEEPYLTNARIALCSAVANGLKASLALLGVSAPQRLHREDQSPS